MDKLDVGERSWSVGLVAKQDFEFFDGVGRVDIHIKSEGLLTGGDFETNLYHLSKIQKIFNFSDTPHLFINYLNQSIITISDSILLFDKQH